MSRFEPKRWRAWVREKLATIQYRQSARHEPAQVFLLVAIAAVATKVISTAILRWFPSAVLSQAATHTTRRPPRRSSKELLPVGPCGHKLMRIEPLKLRTKGILSLFCKSLTRPVSPRTRSGQRAPNGRQRQKQNSQMFPGGGAWSRTDPCCAFRVTPLTKRLAMVAG